LFRIRDMKHTWVGMCSADEEEETVDCTTLSFSSTAPRRASLKTPMNGARVGLCAGRTPDYNNCNIKYKYC
jgi:hypothetical protein